VANTYTQIFIQIVFAVKYRESLIPSIHREELHKYMTGIVQKRGHKMLAVFCMPDHTHLFVGMKPTQSISDLTRDVKAASSGLINEKKWVSKRFEWQNGFGAFSYSPGDIDTVVKYILNQEEHHKNVRFPQEYLAMMDECKIDFDSRYLFDWLE
jgi:putative transposase